LENKEELINKILSLRKEIREHYELVGNSLYLITLELDNYLEWLNKGLQEEKKGVEPKVPNING
jgi:cobalamin biosynthesis Mg chelatase CobN